ncbi:MAG: DNA mismatch repair endonuclease MutL [Anaerolineae bacterium]|nr:DNA mismatch repair endonuclease MutL [Anaerolineae bacterium]
MSRGGVNCGTIRAMSIHVLSDQLASQIAAGEVVERPFSVVKELVENCIDAGATTINIDIQEGGRSRIQIADNGLGIAAEEIETAFLRHATSKLQAVADLNAIRTLGFRGEALAAIAAVSKVTIVSRAAGETAGTRLELDGGKLVSRDSVGAPQGTVIAVENLFYNVPARLKFLKSVTTEKRLIDEFTSRYALAYPHIRFRLTHNGRITFQTSGSGDLRDVLVAVYGPETARELLEIEDQRLKDNEEKPASNLQSSIFVSGFVGPPSLHWANRSHMVLFLNGRYIRDNSLTYAIIQAYHTLLPTGRYPLGIVFITMPAEDVDVNVHPTKTEVRFHHSDRVFSAVQKAVRNTLIAETPIRDMGAWAVPRPTPAAPGWSGELDENAFVRRESDPQPALGFDWTPPAFRYDDEETAVSADPFSSHSPAINPATLPPTADLGGGKLPIMRVIGQIGAAFIITEGPDGVFLIDQHAAHERILYEQFMADWRDEDGVTSQGLVTGTAVHLSPPQATLLNENMATMSQLGFQIEPFGPNAFMVRAIPAILAKLDPAQAVLSVVEDLERGDKPMQGKIEDKIVMRVCKTAAVKAGQTLSQAEMEAMIWQLEKCQNPHTCPHGRPTLIYLSVAQLAKQFGRI